MKGSRRGQSSDNEVCGFRDETDPFNIPSDYTWADANEKKRRIKVKNAEIKKHKKQSAARNAENGGHKLIEDLE
ncbi:hypothetical protein Hanom_Chr08g00698251 [Helianthus anomalus]